MPESYNILKIDSINTLPVYGTYSVRSKAVLNAIVKMHITKGEYIFKKVHLTSEFTAFSEEESITGCIENFNLGNIIVNSIINFDQDNETYQSYDFSKLDAFDCSNISEPFRSLFIKLFTPVVWNLIKRKIQK